MGDLHHHHPDHMSDHHHHQHHKKAEGSSLSIHDNTAGSGTAVAPNERTFQEVDYLKTSLGPILVAALAEICIRRPSDPIEYLGHWLLRYRFNEELKRRDINNALEVVRQKEWAQNQDKPRYLSIGLVPEHPYGPIGYGGPLLAEGDFEGEGDSLRRKRSSYDSEEGDEAGEVKELFHGKHASGGREMLGEYDGQDETYDKIPHQSHHSHQSHPHHTGELAGEEDGMFGGHEGRRSYMTEAAVVADGFTHRSEAIEEQRRLSQLTEAKAEERRTSQIHESVEQQRRISQPKTEGH